MKRVIVIVIALLIFPICSFGADKQLVISWDPCNDCTGHEIRVERVYDNAVTKKLSSIFHIGIAEYNFITTENSVTIENIKPGKWKIIIAAYNQIGKSNEEVKEITIGKNKEITIGQPKEIQVN